MDGTDRTKPSEPPEKTGSSSWMRRLQHVSLRTKLVVPMVALAVFPAVGVGVFTISRMQSALERSAIERVRSVTETRVKSLRQFVANVAEDLRFLSKIRVLQELARAEMEGDRLRSEGLRQTAEEQLLIFSQGERVYYQVRYLDSAGREVVRLNIGEGVPTVVPTEKLQDKSHRYYVQAAFALPEGKIYTSPMDLNVEHGVVEVPHRRVVRYAAPVIGSGRRGLGLVMINVDADHLLSLIGSLAVGEEAWLVDEEGGYLGYVGSSQERASRFHLDQGREIFEDFGAEVISTISEAGEGMGTLETEESILAYGSIAFDPQMPGRKWMLIVGHSLETLRPPIRQAVVVLLVIVALVVAVGGTLGILVSLYLARPVEVLRSATRRIAAGELSQTVAITTGDEIEGLANDFNAMMKQLSRAQARLASWNRDLTREVEEQTEHLQRLQTGFARADKLASLGQMTAGVMHEVGNPLAAIKTRIQVAEEGQNIDEGSQKLLREVLDEVNRLARFLHSFSRFSRLSEPKMQGVSLAEVVDGVMTLVSPELRRRGVKLHVNDVSGISTIRGDPDQLRQLVMNLVLNACDASEAGSEVRVQLRRVEPRPDGNGEGGRIVVEVEDEGMGMDPELLGKIWDPFFTTKPAGAGLGLSICREVIRDHGGEVDVRSSPGAGTTIRVSFPLVEDAEQASSGSEEQGDDMSRHGAQAER